MNVAYRLARQSIRLAYQFSTHIFFLFIGSLVIRYIALPLDAFIYDFRERSPVLFAKQFIDREDA